MEGKMKKRSIGWLFWGNLGVLTATALLLAPQIGGLQAIAQKRQSAPAAIIYDNGPLATGATSRSGTAAPSGQWSEVSYDYGSTTATNTTIGVGCQLISTTTANRCADDFNVPVGQTWTINQVILFAYQTNSSANPFVGVNLQIWRGRPGDVGSTVVFGDTTTNRLASTTDAGFFRISNSGPPTNTVPGTTRIVRQINANVSPAAVLTAGNYWVDFQFDAGASGNFAPPVTITGTRGVPGQNARQFVSSTSTWGDIFDAGNPATEIDIPQDMPFRLDGSVSGAPVASRSRYVDFNGDGKSDLAIARSGSVSGQTTWWTNDGTNVNALPWGLGVGFAGGDIETARDYDGDGRADVSVWRANTGDPNKAYFFTLQSSNNTVAATQFGRTGDDPTIVDDYDGDGKADYAVFRGTPAVGFNPCGAGQSAFYYRPSATPATNFSTVCWGLTGDKPYPGDFDGDRKADFVVIRNTGGSAVHYQQLSGGGTSGFQYGLFTDKFVSGDFDGDGRTDLCAVRDNGSGRFDWYIIKSATGQSYLAGWGTPATDYIIPGDYDGDGKTDFSVWRSGTGADSGYFYTLRTISSPSGIKFGQSAASLTSPDYPVGTALGVH